MLIKNRELVTPIIQGGMGVGISLGGLAGAVAKEGAMGTISTAFCGFAEKDFNTNTREANLRALEHEIKRAKDIAGGRGMIAVNAMVATTQFEESVICAIDAGADAIVCGAGLPTELPGIAAKAEKGDSALAPIVSSGRAASVICRAWDRRYSYLPDFVVLEGPLAGGHLGYQKEEAESAQAGRGPWLKNLLREVLEALKPFEEKAGRKIPVFVGGGIKDGRELSEYMKEGAAGGQFATRFITTEECDASEAYKHRYLKGGSDEIVIVKSPVGMPGRAFRTPLIRNIEDGGRIPPKTCRKCIVTCNPGETPYCISNALIAARNGDYDNGLFFCGAGAGSRDRITTVKEEIELIMSEVCPA